MIPVRLPACALARGPVRRIGDMSFRLNDIDPVGLALDWLETAMRNRDPYLAYTKVNFFFDPLRKEPRYQAIERALKFPE